MNNCSLCYSNKEPRKLLCKHFLCITCVGKLYNTLCPICLISIKDNLTDKEYNTIIDDKNFDPAFMDLVEARAECRAMQAIIDKRNEKNN